MKNKLFAVTLSICLAFTMMFPVNIFATGTVDGEAAGGVTDEMTDVDVAADVDENVAADTEADVDADADEDVAADVEESVTEEVTEDVNESTARSIKKNGTENVAKDGLEESGKEPAKDPIDPQYAQIPDSYMENSILDLYNEGLLVLPEGFGEDEKNDDVYVSKNEKGDGLFFKGKKAVATGDKIQIAAKYNFNNGKVGRIKVDGLADRGMKASVKVYLDEETNPVAVVPLKCQMGKTGWKKEVSYTVDVLNQDIIGEHDVSIRLVDESSAAEDDTVSFLLRSIEFAESSVPVLWFDIDETQSSISAMNGDENHDTECYGNVTLQVPDTYTYEYNEKKPDTGTFDLEYIRGRGNSTWWADKKPYKVKLDKKKNLLGMGKNKHWILLANRYDNSSMRNKMTYWLGEQLGMEFTPQSVPVEVVMNGDYYGTYYLTEQIRVDENRVNIPDLEEVTKDFNGPEVKELPELSGGYLISMNPYGDEPTYEDCTLNTEKGMMFFLEHPSFEDYMNTIQLGYIFDYLQKTENAIFGKNFKDASGKSYEEYLDIAAAVDYFWVQELSCNGDAYGSGSTYLYKKRGSKDENGNYQEGKLYWGPLWDFDYVAWGNLQYDYYNLEDLHYTTTPWFDRLRSDPAFIKKVKARWPQIKKKMNEITCEGGLLDQYYEQLYVPMKYDREKWGAYGDGGGYYGYDAEPSEEAERSYSDEVEQLRDWIKQRVSYVDENLSKIQNAQYKIRFKADKKVIETRILSEDDVIGTLPKAPTKKGYTFIGWYYYDEYISPDWKPYVDAVIKAKYVKKGSEVKAKKLYLNTYNTMGCLEDEGIYLQYRVYPTNAANQDVKWKSSDKTIATVDSYGYISFKKKGTVSITGSIKNGPSATCKIKIVKDYDEMEYMYGFSLSKTSIKISKGNTAQIRVKTKPTYCDFQYLTWISADTKIATVNDMGVVKAKKPGKTYIFAINPETSTVKKCAVTVLKTANPMVVKGKTVTVRYPKLKRQSQTIKRSKAITLSKDKGKVTYVKKKGNKKIKIAKKTGKITVKKGLKKGTYKLKVKVTAAGNKTYRQKSKIITVRIKVK